MIKALFFDAVGTLFYLSKSVGENYALVGKQFGIQLEAEQLDLAFFATWGDMPKRHAIDGPRENDDKDWWHELVDRMLVQIDSRLDELDRDNFFEIAYKHFAEAGVWQLYPEVMDVLGEVHRRFSLAVVSNFDGRLRMILEHLGISRFFQHVFVSSEIGADKPDPEIFRRALQIANFKPAEVLHAGDDPERDWEAAGRSGLSVFRLDRRANSLRDLEKML